MKKLFILLFLPLVLPACNFGGDKLYGTYNCTVDFKPAGKAEFGVFGTMTRYPEKGVKLKNNAGEDVSSRDFKVDFDSKNMTMQLVDPDTGVKSRSFIVSPDFSSYKATNMDYHCERN